jgi:hypothetical protein
MNRTVLGPATTLLRHPQPTVPMRPPPLLPVVCEVATTTDRPRQLLPLRPLPHPAQAILRRQVYTVGRCRRPARVTKRLGAAVRNSTRSPTTCPLFRPRTGTRLAWRSTLCGIHRRSGLSKGAGSTTSAPLLRRSMRRVRCHSSRRTRALPTTVLRRKSPSMSDSRARGGLRPT